MKTNMIIKRAALLLTISGMAAWSNGQAATYTWDADVSVSGAQDGGGVWDATGTNFWNGDNVAPPLNPAANNDIVFGSAATGTTYTVKVSGGGALLAYAAASAVNHLKFNSNYNLVANAVGDGLAVGNLTVTNSATVSVSAALSTVGAFKTWNVGGGSVLNLSGGGQLQNLTGNLNSGVAQINISGGAWQSNNSGDWWFSASQGADLKVTQSGGTVKANGSIKMGAPTNGIGTVAYELSGGQLDASGVFFNVGVDNTPAGHAVLTVSGGTLKTNSEFRIANDGGSGVMNVSGGLFDAGLVVLARRAGSGPTVAEFNISGGTVKLTRIETGPSQAWVAGSKAVINLTGGEFYMAGDIVSNFATTSAYLPALEINLGGGTLGATQNWASAVKMTLTGSNGDVKFRAADDAGVARNITLSGVLSGTGGLEKTGNGTLLLSGANTYEGDTIVSVGTLELRDALALGGVADLKLSNGVTVNLNFGTGNTATIDRLWFDGDIISALNIGQTYTATELNGFLSGNTIFTGDSKLIISNIPEPSTWLLLGVGVGLLAMLRRREKANSSFGHGQ